MIKELQKAQEKLQAIDKLSNCIQKVNKEEAREISYLIHNIIEADYIDITLARKIMGFQLLSNKELFYSV